jgi:hypothetical protein
MVTVKRIMEYGLNKTSYYKAKAKSEIQDMAQMIQTYLDNPSNYTYWLIWSYIEQHPSVFGLQNDHFDFSALCPTFIDRESKEYTEKQGEIYINLLIALEAIKNLKDGQ